MKQKRAAKWEWKGNMKLFAQSSICGSKGSGLPQARFILTVTSKPHLTFGHHLQPKITFKTRRKLNTFGHKMYRIEKWE